MRSLRHCESCLLSSRPQQHLRPTIHKYNMCHRGCTRHGNHYLCVLLQYGYDNFHNALVRQYLCFSCCNLCTAWDQHWSVALLSGLVVDFSLLPNDFQCHEAVSVRLWFWVRRVAEIGRRLAPSRYCILLFLSFDSIDAPLTSISSPTLSLSRSWTCFFALKRRLHE